MDSTSVLHKVVSVLIDRFNSRATPAVDANVITGPFSISCASATTALSPPSTASDAEEIEALDSSASTYQGQPKATALLTNILVEQQFIAAVLSTDPDDFDSSDEKASISAAITVVNEPSIVVEAETISEPNDAAFIFHPLTRFPSVSDDLEAVPFTEDADDLLASRNTDSDLDSDYDDDDELTEEDLDAPFETLSPRARRLARKRSEQIRDDARKRALFLTKNPTPYSEEAPTFQRRRSALDLGQRSPLRRSWTIDDAENGSEEILGETCGSSASWGELEGDELEDVEDLEAFFGGPPSPVSSTVPSAWSDDEDGLVMPSITTSRSAPGTWIGADEDERKVPVPMRPSTPTSWDEDDDLEDINDLEAFFKSK